MGSGGIFVPFDIGMNIPSPAFVSLIPGEVRFEVVDELEEAMIAVAL